MNVAHRTGSGSKLQDRYLLTWALLIICVLDQSHSRSARSCAMWCRTSFFSQSLLRHVPMFNLTLFRVLFLSVVCLGGARVCVAQGFERELGAAGQVSIKNLSGRVTIVAVSEEEGRKGISLRAESPGAAVERRMYRRKRRTGVCRSRCGRGATSAIELI
jgi:hypothetical protein